MTRVLMGAFGTMVAIGLKKLLEERGCEVAEGPDPGLMDHIAFDPPEVVVVDLDDGGDRLATTICLRFPAVKVVAFSSRDPRMRVFSPHCPSGAGGVPLTVDGLLAEVTHVESRKRGM